MLKFSAGETEKKKKNAFFIDVITFTSLTLE